MNFAWMLCGVCEWLVWGCIKDVWRFCGGCVEVLWNLQVTCVGILELAWSVCDNHWVSSFLTALLCVYTVFALFTAGQSLFL